MIPVSLTISGFLSYREEVTLNFETFDIACIAGPNGAGKSSLLDAITYALFGKARKADETLINLQSDAAFVEMVFSYEGNHYRVQRTNPRGKTTILEFQIAQEAATWKSLTERTVRDTQARIDETLRLDYDTFINAAFFLQGKADQFTQQRPAERKRILSNILGLETWETYRSRAVERRKGVEAAISSLDGRLSEIVGELSQEKERKARLKELSSDLERMETQRATQESVLENMRKLQATLEAQQQMVDNLKRGLDAARQRVGELQARRETRLQEKETFSGILSRSDEIRAAFEAVQQTRARLAEWDETALKFNEHEARRNEPLAAIREEKARLETERDALIEKEAELEESLTKKAVFDDELVKASAELAVLDEALKQKADLEAELSDARQRQAEASAENPRLRDEMHELRDRIEQLKETEGATCPLCGQPLSPERRVELVGELEKEGKTLGDRFRENDRLLKEADENVKAIRMQLGQLATVESTHRARQGQLSTLHVQIEQIEQDKTRWEEEHVPRLAEIRKALAGETYAPEARQALAAIDAELKAIGYDAAEHDRVRKEAEAGAAVDEQIRALDRAEAALAPLDRELGELDEELEKAGEEAEQKKREYDAAAAVLADASQDAPNVYQAQRDLLAFKEEENHLRMEVGAARQKVEVLSDLRERRKRLESERHGLAEQAARYKQLEKAFGKNGVPALLIEQALPQIESKANEILERLSRGGMSVRFETQRSLKTRDDLKETLDITISDAAGTRDYEMYSGGEAFRVNFAIRLALSEVLAQRAGARLQTLVIDEGFGSQDLAGRQRLVEAINMVRDEFEKILVITHIDELKDAFPTRIEVTKGAQGSQIAVVG